MRVSNAWNREIESEKERRRHAERERLRIQLWRSDKHARSAIEFVLEHGAPCCTAFTNNTRLRSFMYKRMHIKCLLLRIYASTKWTRRDVWWEVARGRRGTCFWGRIHSWIQGAVMNSEMWLDGRSVILVTRTRFSANGGTVRYKSTLERTRDG